MIQRKNILVKNVYHMLSYAFSMLDDPYYQEIEKEEFEHIHDLLAAILSKGISQQIKRGLYREYQTKAEDLSVLRGRVKIKGTIDNRLAKRRVLRCEYDELTENNLLNQILKSTSILLLRHGKVSPENKDSLKRNMLFFSTIDSIDLSLVPWTTIRFRRNNLTYRLLISICELVGEGMILTTEEGEHKLASFFNEEGMSRLYEKFLLEFYRKEFPQFRASASHISWDLDDEVRTLLPVMKSDITLTLNERVLIIDAKYYAKNSQYYKETQKIHSSNLYQIFTYVKNKRGEKKSISQDVSGLLLYARTEDAIQPEVTYQMSGNRIGVKTLDLNADFHRIAHQLFSIVEEFFS